MKIFFSTISLIAILLGLLGVEVFDHQEIFFESQESKTLSMDPVFNKIRWFSEKDRDIWMMNQSHHGMHAPDQAWDRLAIVVDKKKNTVSYHQLQPGPLEWKEPLQEAPFRVKCYMCHSNGPRAIRPDPVSATNPWGWKDSVKVFMWNLKIKSYGRLNLDLESPARWSGKFENEPLKVATCIRCHKESGFLARGTLLRQHIPTIKFMMEESHMPPFPFSLSEKEKSQLKDFLAGF